MAAVSKSGNTNPGQRTLAAIVFTDVVSFSARMHADELGTLRLLQRDFAEMRRICLEHEGSVLKTTGDGLLLTFTSAVQAVACALAMQRQFAAEAQLQAPGDALQHRIGIHLGDVLVQDEDVMGDGVNIAARLQSEAEPGGICISQTVYDVVKNKLEMQVVSLGARDLKNIAQAMPVYRLLLEAQALDGGAPAAASARSGSSRKPRAPLFLVLGAALAAVGAAGIYFMRQRSAAPTAGAPPVVAAPVPAASPAATPAAPISDDLAAELAGEYAKRKDVMQELHSRYLDKYDFDGLVVAIRSKAEAAAAPQELKQLLRSAEALSRLKSWVETFLRRYSFQRPLHVHDLSGDATKDLSVFLSADLRVVTVENGKEVPHDWPDLKPATVGAIIVTVVKETRLNQRGMAFGAQAFSRLYNQPAVAEALGEKARRERDPGK